MKLRISLLLLFAFFLAACNTSAPEKNQVRLSGHIENAGDQPVEFVYFSDNTNNQREVITLGLDEMDRFSVDFSLISPIAGTLRHGRINIKLFLEPAQDLDIYADASDWPGTIVVKGSAAHNNICFLDYQLDVEQAFSQSFFSNAIKDNSPGEFIRFMENVTQKRMHHIDYCRDNFDLSVAFEEYLETEILYDKYNRLLAYPEMHQRLNQDDVPPRLPEDYYSFLDPALQHRNNPLISETYTNFLIAYMGYESIRDTLFTDEGISAQKKNYLLAGELLQGDARDFVKAVNINRELNFGNIKTAREMFNDFMESGASRQIKNRVQSTMQAIQALGPGNPAPEFTMTDINGNVVSLSDFRDKVVYLKFWASWCGPCMRQVPPAAELKNVWLGKKTWCFCISQLTIIPRTGVIQWRVMKYQDIILIPLVVKGGCQPFTR
jgi:hypothetical protein